MSVVDTINTALSAYDPAIGEWPDGDAGDYCVIVPLYDKPTEADNEFLVVDEYFDVHFFYKGNYQAVKTAASAALEEAGLVLDPDEPFHYIECAKQQHHFVLTVIGRA